MKNSQIISEVSRIREIMGIELSQSTPLNEGIIPRSALISAAAQALPSVLLKTTGKAALDAIDDVEKASIKTILKNVDNTLTDAVLDAKTGSELVSDLVEAGQKYASKFGVDGASALVRIMTKVDDFADEMVVKISSNPEIASQLDDIAKRLPRNPKLYDKTLDTLKKEFGEDIAKKILKSANVTPAFGSGTIKLSMESLATLESVLKSNSKMRGYYNKILKNNEIMDAIYKKADDMFAKGETISTSDVFKIIDDLAPEEVKPLLKKSWSDMLQNIYMTQTGSIRWKSMAAGALLIYGLTGFYTAESEVAEAMGACLTTPNKPIKSGNQIFYRTYTKEMIQSGMTANLSIEEQRLFDIVKRQCAIDVEAEMAKRDWWQVLNRTLGSIPNLVLWIYNYATNKTDEVVDSESDAVIVRGVDDKTPTQTEELTGEQILEKFKEQYPGKSKYWGPYKWEGQGPDYWGYTDDEATEYVDYYYLYDKNTGIFKFADPAVRRPKNAQNNQN